MTFHIHMDGNLLKTILTVFFSLFLIPAHSSCEPTPCQNGGTCTVVSHGFECTCSPGFMGTHCERKPH